VAAGVVDELVVYLAPSVIGESGRGMFDLPEIADLAGRRRLALRDVQRIGEDLRLVARLA
jgi:diaminohydroxyphosphoribosylaminopyrimidine deaminase/5-amino-6-(5-phosphoribosylamino)uracil reductase